jgi:osmotically-inducible protein OsmY
MGLLSRFMKPKFQDEQLVARAQGAIEEDPLIATGSDIHVVSDKGILLIKGSVANDREKNHVEGTVRSAMRQSGLKFERIENHLTIRR